MITVNIEKAKEIGHAIRREKRAKEFAPLDDVIAKQMPGADFDAVEAERQAIRDRYAVIQIAIDGAATPEGIKAALGMGSSG